MKPEEPFKSTPWFRDDPRYHIWKRAKIIILFPDDTGYHKAAAVGEVDTEEGWYIGISNYGLSQGHFRSSVSADEDWPKSWIWTYHP